MTRPAPCHPDRLHLARGLCRPCYDAAWRAEHREERRASYRVWLGANRDKADAATRRWRDANREQVLAGYKAWKSANRERNSEGQRRWYEANRAKAIASAAGRVRRWRKEHPEESRVVRTLENNRRRERIANLAVVVAVASDECGVCAEPLTTHAYPHPLATTVGHEPPLSVAVREGWRIVVARPEHSVCNSAKGARPDYVFAPARAADAKAKALTAVGGIAP